MKTIFEKSIPGRVGVQLPKAVGTSSELDGLTRGTLDAP